MDPIKRKEGVLHAIVKEYLEYSGFADTLSTYEGELQTKNVTAESVILPNQNTNENVNTKELVLERFDEGTSKIFWIVWEENIPNSFLEENDTQRLEFLLRLYFAVSPMITNEHLLIPVEESMQEFKQYLETNGAALSQTTEFVAYYALPYVPNPRNHPTFKILFEDSWKEELRLKLESFLDTVFPPFDLPYLYRLYCQTDDQSLKEREIKEMQAKIDEVKLEFTLQMNTVRQQAKEHEYRANTYFQKFAKLQGDYHNLIGISAELVDSLEKCVRGELITPEYLQDICERLFNQTNKSNPPMLDLTRPGTTGSLLRASVTKDYVVTTSHEKEDECYPTLNFSKIQQDLSGELAARRKALLLQAMIWRLTKSSGGKQRDSAISSYLSSDFLGCTAKAIPIFVKEIFGSGEDIVSEYLARLINTIASFSSGRLYMSNCEEFVKYLVRLMMKLKTESLTSENIVGGLQKLSLKRNVQDILIESAVIEWLLKTLEEPDNLSDYALEYTVALLMNLCLRTSGKKKCCLRPEKTLKLLAELLGYENQEVRPYLNGTLYSLLSLPSIRTAAKHMGLEEVFNIYLKDKDQDERQIKFIIKQMNVVDLKTDDDVYTDGEDDEEDDEEGDAVETESEKEESIKAIYGEKSGEELLNYKYTNAATNSLLMSVTSSQAKTKKKQGNSIADEPFTRPVTPASKPNRQSVSQEDEKRVQPIVRASHDRPRTSSSKSARKPPAEQAKQKVGSGKPVEGKASAKSYKQAFVSRPKIPRTPDTSSSAGSSRQNSATEVPLLTRSMSPPRPTSAKSTASTKATAR